VYKPGGGGCSPLSHAKAKFLGRS